MLPSLLSTCLLEETEHRSLCSAVDNAQVPSQTQNHPVPLAYDLAKSNSQAPAVGCFNLFGSWMLRRSLCSAHRQQAGLYAVFSREPCVPGVFLDYA